MSTLTIVLVVHIIVFVLIVFYARSSLNDKRRAMKYQRILRKDPSGIFLKYSKKPPVNGTAVVRDRKRWRIFNALLVLAILNVCAALFLSIPWQSKMSIFGFAALSILSGFAIVIRITRETIGILSVMTGTCVTVISLDRDIFVTEEYGYFVLLFTLVLFFIGIVFLFSRNKDKTIVG